MSSALAMSITRWAVFPAISVIGPRMLEMPESAIRSTQ